MADAVDAVDDFLPDVAAFGVSNGAALDAAFERDVRLVHVRAESRNARLNARRIERLPATRASADLFCGGDQFVRHRAEGIVWDEQIKAACSESRQIRQINVTERNVGNFHGARWLARNFCKQIKRAN